MLNYDTVLPEKIVHRYRRPRFRVPRWIKESLQITAFFLVLFTLIGATVSIVNPQSYATRKAAIETRGLAQRALARIGPTPPPLGALPAQAPRATLVKLPLNWNNVCTP